MASPALGKMPMSAIGSPQSTMPAANCFEIGVGDTTAAVRAAMQRHPYLAEAGALPEANTLQCAAWQSERAPPAFFAPVHSEVPSLLYGGAVSWLWSPARDLRRL